VAPGAYLIGPAASDGSYDDSFFDEGNKYATLSGTSVSTPVISGMVAVLMNATGASPNAIKVALMQSATELEYTQYRRGYGVPSAIGAYELLIDPDWEPALFLPNEAPLEPIAADDVLDYPIVVITGKNYEGAYFETDLPLVLPEIDGIDGHYILELELDIASLDDNPTEEGYIRLMSKDDDILAEMKLSIVVVNAFDIISLVIVAIFVIALSAVGAYMAFNFVGKKKALAKCPCVGQPGCECDVK
jgi:subtilisin family serine protease